MGVDGVKNPSTHVLDAALAGRFTAMLAARTLTMNDRIQILSNITIRGKLVTLFSQLAARAGAQEFAVPFDRGDMAAYLGVNRSALSRELSKMRDEGIIDFHKNEFKITRKFEH
jgi:CRP-like cAMP-binding protein